MVGAIGHNIFPFYKFELDGKVLKSGPSGYFFYFPLLTIAFVLYPFVVDVKGKTPRQQICFFVLEKKGSMAAWPHTGAETIAVRLVENLRDFGK